MVSSRLPLIDQAGAKQVLHSQSTMRAVSVENGEPRVEVSERQPVIVSLPPRRRKSRLLIVAIAAGLVGAIGGGVLHKSSQRASAQRTGVDMGAPVAHAAAPTEALDKHDVPMVAKEPVPIVNAASSAEPPPQVGPSTAPLVLSKKRATRRAESTPASPEAASLPAAAPAPLNASPAGDPLDRRK